MPRRDEIILDDGERLHIIPSPDEAPRRPRWWNRRIPVPLVLLLALVLLPLLYTNQVPTTPTTVDPELATRFFNLPPFPTPAPTRTVQRTPLPVPTLRPTAAATPAFVVTPSSPTIFPATHTYTPQFLRQLNNVLPVPTSDYPSCIRATVEDMTIVLASAENGEEDSDLYLLMPGNRVDQMCRLSVYPNAFSPRWSPDGTQVVFSAVLGGRRDIFMWHTSNEFQRITTGEREEYFPDWGLSGNHIWHLAEQSLYHQEGGNANQAWGLPTEVSELLNAEAYDLAVAPNSQYFAFVSSADNPSMPGIRGRELYIISARGTNLRRLTTDDVPDSAPTWSPDGEWIAWVAGEPGQLWLYNVVNDQRVRFVDSRDYALSSPVWLPNNDGIAFIMHTETTRVIVAQMFNGATRVITGQFPNMTSFDWR
jgi:dipeptidyl aminopeptidase/acylaminoacyl peptidase